MEANQPTSDQASPATTSPEAQETETALPEAEEPAEDFLLIL